MDTPDQAYMRRAIELARQAEATGEVPVGAVIVRGKEIIAEGFNRPISTHDPTAHAEMIALQLAERRIASYTLAADGHPAHELFTSCAPCAMCLGAALWSGVTRIVFGGAREDAERVVAAMRAAPYGA